MRKILMLGLTLVFMLSLAACGSQSSSGKKSGNGSGNSTSSKGSSASSGKKMTLKLSDDQPKGYPTVQGDEAFAKEVKQKTNGRIQIKVYAGGSLGAEGDVAQQVQLGSVDLQRINAAPLAEYDSDMGVLSMPYLFKSSKQKWDVLNGKVGQQLLDSLKSSKMVGLTYYDSGSRSFYDSKRPIKKPSDLKGLKIRVQKSKLFISMVKALGASATPMAFSDVYSALQTGVIDGAENNLPSYYTTNHYKVAKYYTFDKHSQVPEVLLASKKTWDKLSPSDQKIFKQAAMDSQKVERKSWNALVKKSRKKVLAGGAKFYQVKDTSAWRKAVQPVYDKYGSKYKKYLDEIKKVN